MSTETDARVLWLKYKANLKDFIGISFFYKCPKTNEPCFLVYGDEKINNLLEKELNYKNLPYIITATGQIKLNILHIDFAEVVLAIESVQEMLISAVQREYRCKFFNLIDHRKVSVQDCASKLLDKERGKYSAIC